MKISGLTIVRNAIANGYLIAEVIDTLVAISDEVIVCDGFSTDGTFEYLSTRGDIKLYQDVWDLQSSNGFEFANITNKGMSRCTGDYIFYLQADELIHEDQYEDLRKLILSNEYNSISCKFHHIRYSFDHSLVEGYDLHPSATRASRVVRNKDIYSSSDGFNFDGSIHPQYDSNINIYHYGYIFLENILAKMINHSDNFYLNAPNYANRKRLSHEYLERVKAGESFNLLQLQKILEPNYTLNEHGLQIPECMKRLQLANRYTLPTEEERNQIKLRLNNKKKQYFFDLDETLCLTPVSRDYTKAVPMIKMIEDVNRLYDDGFTITIYTARGSSSDIDYHDLNIKQLSEWGVKFHHLIDKGKPSYDVLVDDKAFNTTAWRALRNIKLTGFVASSFDLLHAGHCLYLEDAKSKCDYLIAALHSDPTIDRQDKNKPIQSVDERLIQLRSCKYVDEIIQYDTEKDLEVILESIKPDIRFVGSDTDCSNIAGLEYCKTIYIHDRSHGYSTSELRGRVLNAIH